MALNSFTDSLDDRALAESLAKKHGVKAKYILIADLLARESNIRTPHAFRGFPGLKNWSENSEERTSDKAAYLGASNIPGPGSQ